MSNWGFKVSKDGYDVTTATDAQLAATSAMQSEVVLLSGSFTHTHMNGVDLSGTTSSSTALVHNLGLRQFLVATNLRFVPIFFGTEGTASAQIWQAKTTSTTLTFSIDTGSNMNIIQTVYYKILYNPIV